MINYPWSDVGLMQPNHLDRIRDCQPQVALNGIGMHLGLQGSLLLPQLLLALVLAIPVVLCKLSVIARVEHIVHHSDFW